MRGAEESSAAGREPPPKPGGSASTPAKAQTAPPAAGTSKRGVWEWIWRGAALRQARHVRASLPDSAVESARQGRLAAELAGRVLDPTEPLGHGTVDSLACELYRQATYWMLRSCLERSPNAGGPDVDAEDVKADAADVAVPSQRLQEVWSAVDARGLLPNVEKPVPNFADVKSQLLQHDFVDFGGLSKSEQTKLARGARSLSQALIAELDVSSTIASFWRQRLVRGALLLGVLVALGVGALNIRDAYRMKSDLAQGKPWYVSSSNRLGCQSPAQTCEGGKDFFFHTLNQAQPWFAIDLGSVQRFSSVYIENRRDCCYHRVIPLVVEVSNDGKTWKEVARRTEVFTSTWRADFPAVEAKIVRLRIERWSMLHLAAVKVLP